MKKLLLPFLLVCVLAAVGIGCAGGENGCNPCGDEPCNENPCDK